MINKKRIGKNQEKMLLLLMTGVSLGFTRSPKQYYRIIGMTKKIWGEINKRGVDASFNRLVETKLISFEEINPGIFKAVLTKYGKKEAISLSFKNIEIKKPKNWDKLWRVVIFDVPEKNRMARDSLRGLLKRLGFFELQKSVFVFPYDCENEVYKVVDFFNIHQDVNFILAKYINDEIKIKKYFKLK